MRSGSRPSSCGASEEAVQGCDDGASTALTVIVCLAMYVCCLLSSLRTLSLHKCLRRSSVDERESRVAKRLAHASAMVGKTVRGKQPANEVSKREAAPFASRKSKIRRSRSSKSGPAQTHRKLRRFTLPSEVIKRLLAWLTATTNRTETVDTPALR